MKPFHPRLFVRNQRPRALFASAVWRLRSLPLTRVMGRYDDISAEQLRSDLVNLARLILKMDKQERILTSAPDLQRLFGEMRQKLFAYEIRASLWNIGTPGTESDGEVPAASSTDEADPVVRDSLKVVRDALRRTEEMLREWDGGHEEAVEEDD